jgi:hypothetical protein
MPLRFRITEREPYLVVKISGLAFLHHAERLLQDVAQAVNAAGVPLLMLDMLNVLRTLAPHDHSVLGHLLAAHLSGVRKVAAVIPAGKVALLSEGAAAERGLNLRVFASHAEAHAWLLS